MKKKKRIKQLETEVMEIFGRLAKVEEDLGIIHVPPAPPPTPIQGINTKPDKGA